jgi:hypothetical protein
VTDLFTWADVWKLFLTLTASLTSPLLIIWANFIYQRNRELREKQEYLWRSIHKGSQGYPDASEKLDEIVDKLKKGEPTIRGFYIPKQQIEFSERLAEICLPSYSYIYSDYANRLQTVQISLNLLTDLMKEIYRTLLNNPNVDHLEQEEINRKICSILEARIETAKEEILKLVKTEKEVLSMLHSSSKQFSKDSDGQLLNNFNQVAQDLEKKINNNKSARK